jgi:hypothetical protein
LTVLLFLQNCWAMQTPTGLRLQVTEGANAVYTVEQVPDNNIAVRLLDSAGRPVPDVAIVFTAPQSGPGGEFPNGLTTITVLTDTTGLAVTRLYHPNAIAGLFDISARAEFNGQTATTTIRQRNDLPRRGMNKKILIFAAVGAAAGAAFAIGGGGSNNTNNPRNTPTISFGNSTIGAPQP